MLCQLLHRVRTLFVFRVLVNLTILYNVYC